MINPKKVGKKKEKGVEFNKVLEHLNKNFVNSQVFSYHRIDVGRKNSEFNRTIASIKDTQLYLYNMISSIPEILSSLTNTPLDKINEIIDEIYLSKIVVTPGGFVNGSVELRKYNCEKEEI